jgi:hypothetical protein
MNKVIQGRPRAVRMVPVLPPHAISGARPGPAAPAGLASRLAAWLTAWHARRRAARIRRRFAAFERRLDARLRQDLGLGSGARTPPWQLLGDAHPMVLFATRSWEDEAPRTTRAQRD